MNRLSFYIIALLFLSACGSQEKKEDNNKKSFTKIDKINKTHNTLALNALGKELIWQKEVKKFDYKSAVEYCKNLTLDGKSDWRLPSSKEFFALLDNNSSIDEQFEKSSDIKSLWTRDEFALDKKMAWKLNSWSNSISYSDKNSSFGVRCVRGDMLSNDPLKNRENREIIWRDEKNSKDALFTYDEAKEYCKNKKLRLPTIHELQNSIDLSSLKSSLVNIDKNEFISYFSSTTLPTNSDEVMTLNFKTGMISFNKKDELNHLICVGEKNHPPTVTQNQSVELQEDSQKNITLGGMDKDGDELKIIIKKMPDHGTYKDGIYTPDANFHGKDSIKYKLFDSKEYSKEAEVVINVLPINDPPKAKSFDISLDEDSNITFKLEASDVDEDTLSYKIIQDALHGELIRNNNVITYIPNRDYDKNDTFRYIAKDGNDSFSNIATVHINIKPINDKPKAFPQIVYVDQNGEKDINLSGIDIDSKNLTFSHKNPSHGSLSGDSSHLTFKAESGYVGDDSFIYTVSDGELRSDEATIKLIIGSNNKAPTAKDINLTLDLNDKDSIKITLLGSDFENSPLSYQIDRSKTKGSISGNAPDLIYTPKSGFMGVDSFRYRVSDGYLHSNWKSVNIFIKAKKPKLKAQNFRISEDDKTLYSKVALEQGKALSFSTTNPPIGFKLDINGSFSFDPSNEIYQRLKEQEKRELKIPITVVDRFNQRDTKELIITVIGKNDTPKTFTIDEYQLSENGGVVDLKKLVYDIDSNNSLLRFDNVSANTNVELNLKGEEINISTKDSFSYLKNGESATFNLNYMAFDELNSSINGSIKIRVIGENTPPVAKIILNSSTAYVGEPITFDASSSFDYDGNIKRYRWSENGNELSNKISFNYTPQRVGLHNITLQIWDNNGSISTVNKTITVTNNDSSSNYQKFNIDSEDTYNVSWIEIAKMDNDNLSDLIVTYTNINKKSKVIIYRNLGDGNFEKHLINYNDSSNIYINLAKVSDINGDGKKDLLLSSDKILVCINNNDSNDLNNSFNCDISLLSSQSVSYNNIKYFTIDDFDQNNKRDIVYITENNTLKLYNQNSNNKFLTEANLIDQYLNDPTWVESIKIDKTGLVISDISGVKYYQNQNNSDFDTPKQINDLKTNSLSIANINNIGRPDVIMTHDIGIDWTTVLISTQINGSVDEYIINPPYAQAIDMDKDGDIDIVSNSNIINGEIVWYESNVNKKGSYKVSFKKHIIASQVNNISITKAADLDNDGDIDIISGDESGNLYLFKQN